LRKLSVIVVLFFIALAVAHDALKKDKDSICAMIHNWLEQDLKAYEENEAEEEEEKRTDEPDKFLQFHRGIRTRDGEFGPNYPPGYKWSELELIRNNQFARKRSKAGRTLTNGVVEWKERGPANVPGRTRALFNIPGDPGNNTWLAGSATGGIWRTDNGGASWSERSSDFPALPISSFSADATASVIYAGTGEYVSSVFSATGNGIFKSTDKGITWSQLPATNNHPDFSIITRLIVNPTNAAVIVATSVPSNLTTDNTSAIMRSTDGGASWTKVKEITGIFEQIIATPGNFTIQYASQHGVGVWKSNDGGVTWNLSNTGMSPSGRIELAVSPVMPNRVFASAEGPLSGTESDLYYSSNAGVSWSLVDVKFNNATVDFLEGQGFYDNTIMCDPFDEDIVYFGGVSIFRTTLGVGSSQVDNFKIEEQGTSSFLFLQSFSNILHDNQRLTVGDFNSNITVEVRFGPGRSQKGHSFFVPAGKTNGVQASEFSYQNYVTIPFEVWDITNNRQLMVSFRDQNRNGKFDLIAQNLTSTTDVPTALLNSREYFYINNVDYSASGPNANIAQSGGQEYRLMYSFFPALTSGGSWDENNLPVSKLVIKNAIISKLTASTLTVADGRGAFDKKNKSNQILLFQGVHPDHHCMVPVVISSSAKTYKILLGNDGGIFCSKVSANPGTTEGDWQFKGSGYNTSQFYGADKKPGADEYVGGMQDNGTRFSPAGQIASALTDYTYGLGGDGFEVIWNSKDPNKILGSVYNGQISRSLNGGSTWADATAGLNPNDTEFAFLTKLANAKDFPDRVFTVGKQGVYVSQDFGGSWQLTPIAQKFILTTPFYLDVEVSRANANIVWAGSGMNNSGTLRNLHVSVDGGKTFSTTSNFTAVPMGNITKLASHPTQQNTAYALFSFAQAPKILRTVDLGQTWQEISGFGTNTFSSNGFPDVAVYCLYVRPDNPNILWAGTEIGIVESLDNGLTWAIINDFPNVAVWDMRGQDDQVVIATHGRGIWTAKIDQPQTNFNIPQIIASGTSPQKKLVLRIQTVTPYDSALVFVGSTLSQTVKPLTPGTRDLELTGISPGAKEIKLVSYKGSAPYQSSVHKMNHLDVLPQKNSYATYFNSVLDLSMDGLTQQGFPNASAQERKGLQSNHNYTPNKTYQVLVRTPITVSNTIPMLYYRDIAIIEPGKDSVIVEATKNGLDWIPLIAPYDATFQGDETGAWQHAYAGNIPGNTSMFVQHDVDISTKFSAGDLLLFRFRMVSDPLNTSWGWALDYISIQVAPLSVETPTTSSALSVYPNPCRGQVTVSYELHGQSPVTYEVIDAFGRSVKTSELGTKGAGMNSQRVDLENLATGSYILMLRTNEGRKMTKVILAR
jgi:photosystem II stability/assembly factor-like uncharacterized protein